MLVCLGEGPIISVACFLDVRGVRNGETMDFRPFDFLRHFVEEGVTGSRPTVFLGGVVGIIWMKKDLVVRVGRKRREEGVHPCLPGGFRAGVSGFWERVAELADK